jgi:hypothetical protein
MNTTFSGGKHQYRGQWNDRSKRQRSKIMKGINKNQLTHVNFLEWNEICEDIIFYPHKYSNYICDNCKNIRCKNLNEIK